MKTLTQGAAWYIWRTRSSVLMERERERERERKWCEVRLQTGIGNNQITQGPRMSWEGFGFILAKSLFVTYDKDLMQISLSWKGNFLVHIFGKSGIKASGMAGSRNSNSIIKTFFSMSSLSYIRFDMVTSKRRKQRAWKSRKGHTDLNWRGSEIENMTFRFDSVLKNFITLPGGWHVNYNRID